MNKIKYIKTNKVLIIFLSVLFSFQAFNCNSAKDKNISNNENGKTIGKIAGNNAYFPVAENMSWNYISEAPREETELYNVNILSLKSDNESIYAVLDAFPYFTKTNEKTQIRINKSGEVYVKNSSGEENMFLPEQSKLTKGYTWMYGDWNAYVTDSLETVKTEKGTFENCLHVGYGRGGFTFSAQLWFAKDAGIVKWGSFRTNPPALVFPYYVLK